MLLIIESSNEMWIELNFSNGKKLTKKTFRASSSSNLSLKWEVFVIALKRLEPMKQV